MPQNITLPYELFGAFYFIIERDVALFAAGISDSRRFEGFCA
jgi:hypothetical protein